MSSDDFGTVNVKRGDRAREIELLRQRYKAHRDALVQMGREAPSEQLAGEYQRLVRSVEASLAKLNELERGTGGVSEDTQPVIEAPGDSRVGSRELQSVHSDSPLPAHNSRMTMIILAGIIVLGLIGALIWYASRDRGKVKPITTETTAVTNDTATATTTAPQPVAEPPGASALTVAPAIADYGTIHKGTRAVRQVEVTNTTDKQLDYSVSRSQCRCLYYEYTGKLAPKKKETLSITVDGGKAKAGALAETVTIAAKKDPSVTTSFQVAANIK
ncbi:MAG TPA: DUF1573 domain-containing protein [Thermoanaerobaculia bacterium]|jgi:hypothetical protein|nr:DUF1573 domain-containing protein [Thermoanaerobaculia bacterium]